MSFSCEEGIFEETDWQHFWYREKEPRLRVANQWRQLVPHLFAIGYSYKKVLRRRSGAFPLKPSTVSIVYDSISHRGVVPSRRSISRQTAVLRCACWCLRRRRDSRPTPPPPSATWALASDCQQENWVRHLAILEVPKLRAKFLIPSRESGRPELNA